MQIKILIIMVIVYAFIAPMMASIKTRISSLTPFDCSICVRSFCDKMSGPPITLRCSELHQFHLSCMAEWFWREAFPSCPTCNAMVSDDEARGINIMATAFFSGTRKNSNALIGFVSQGNHTVHNVYITNSSAENALLVAAAYGYNDVVKMLISDILALDINVENCSGETPLDLAILYRNTRIVEMLLNAGATVDINRVDEMLMGLVLNDHHEIVSLIKKALVEEQKTQSSCCAIS